MKITSIELKSDINGIKAFCEYDLGDVVLLTGSNGSGKTRLLNIIEDRIREWNKDINNTDILISIENCKNPITVKSVDVKMEIQMEIQTVNYSHFDAKLQTPDQFTPYVISKAKDLLTNYNYEETALNSLLFLQDVAKKYSDAAKDGTVFVEFQKFAKLIFNIDVDLKDSLVTVFKRSLSTALLSPGQQYLLRMAVTCFIHKSANSSATLIFLLDEPELHLHPEALLSLMDKLKETFSEAQFWISTHSLALIAHWASHKSTTTLIMDNGIVTPFRSNSTKLLSGLLGSDDNRFDLNNLLSTPSEYAINRFALECLLPPDVKSSVKRKYSDGTNLSKEDTALIPDRQASLINKIDGKTLDFGAGRGRFLEEYCYFLQCCSETDIGFDYFAYDVSNTYSEQCKVNMRRFRIDDSHYFDGENGFSRLLDSMREKFDSVILANVLHEIEPQHWEDVFSKINDCLNDNGKLYIVEKTELTDGESPYDNGGFLILSPSSAEKLFGNEIEVKLDKVKSNIICYVVKKRELHQIETARITDCINAIAKESSEKIKAIRDANRSLKKGNNDKATFKSGIRLAFWVHQYANASIMLESLKDVPKSAND